VRYVAALIVAGVLAGCGSSSTSSRAGSAASVTSIASSTTTTTTPPATTTTSTPPRSSSPCVTSGGYARHRYTGLYGTVSAFGSDKPTAAPSVRIDGVAWFTSLSTEHGCVTAYSVDEYTTPPLGTADIMMLTDGIYLPA
jgi:hypothetical protein